MTECAMRRLSAAGVAQHDLTCPEGVPDLKDFRRISAYAAPPFRASPACSRESRLPSTASEACTDLTRLSDSTPELAFSMYREPMRPVSSLISETSDTI